MSDQAQRTEQPTPQRLKKAREEGRFPASREFIAAVQFAVFAALVTGTATTWWPAVHDRFRRLLELAFEVPVTKSMLQWLLSTQLMPLAAGLLFAGAAMTAAMLMAQLACTGFGLAPAKLAPDAGRLNPMSHLRELPRKNRTAAQEAVLLLPLMLVICWAVVSANLGDFLRLPLQSLESATRVTGNALSQLAWRSAGILLTWGAIDLFRQRRNFLNDMMMTKQEVREEFKQNEGNPEIKMRIRRLRRELLRRRMMSEVPKATAVVVNPTHFAVALRYDMKEMAAPRVVAKGKNYLALRIRETALRHQVPVIENPPLAQALYKQVEVGQEIPAQLYQAVAEVLAYVLRVVKGGRPEA